MMMLPAPAEVITHRDGMLLLDQITAADEERCVAEYAPRSDAWYADAEGNMPAWIGIELMAQAVAVQVGVQKHRLNLPPKLGMLLGARSYKVSTPHFRAVEPLSVRAQLVFRDESGLAAYDCEIRQTSDPQQILATATLKVFEPDDFPEFLRGTME